MISNGSHAPGVRMPACAAAARRSRTIARQLLGNHRRIRAEVEHPPAPARRSPATRADRRHRRRASAPSRRRPAQPRSCPSCSPIVIVRWYRSASTASTPGVARAARKPITCGPVVGRPVGEAEAITVRTVRSLARELAQLGWCSRKSPADLAVQAAQAAESGRERDLRDRQPCFVDQFLGEVDPPGERDLERRRAKMLHEQPAQVPRRHAEAIGQLLDAFAIERAFADETQPARHHARRARPGRRGGRRLGPAAEAGTESGRLRGRGGRVVADVLVLRRSRRADRPAINARAGDGDEELAVEARIARLPRPIADLADPVPSPTELSVDSSSSDWSETDLSGNPSQLTVHRRNVEREMQQ